MKNQSVTITGLIISLLAFALPLLGIEAGPEEIAQIVAAGGILVAWYGRFRQGDISLLGNKK